MATVSIFHEERLGNPGDWQLCFHWGRYNYDDGTHEFGSRFIWRRENGNLQPGRAQARIPSLADMLELMQRAAASGWLKVCERQAEPQPIDESSID